MNRRAPEAGDNKGDSLGLYLHIPFCARKCLYCDFLSFPASEETRRLYIKRLSEEIRACGRRAGMRERIVDTVFIGGGTPSLLLPEETEALLEAARASFRVDAGAEITMEANPGSFGRAAAGRLRRAGVTRLSLGLQSACDGELARLGRIHTCRAFLESFDAVREAGFDNVNVDLMSGLPGQTAESFGKTLAFTARLGPEHISAYSLIIEEGTPFYETYGAMKADLERYGEWEDIPPGRRAAYQGTLPLPGEAADRGMYHMTKEFLMEQGYGRYEISNYAKTGGECRHNIRYWTGSDYLGLGLGAASLMDGARFTVTRSLKEYLGRTPEDFRLRKQYRETHVLSVREKMEEFMFLGLRMIRGVEAAGFSRRFGIPLEAVYQKACAGLMEDGLLASSGEGDEKRYYLTERGLDVSNCALAEFLFD